MDPLTGALIAGGSSVVGNLIGGIFGKKGGDSANATNIRLARQNRAWQTKERKAVSHWTAKREDLKWRRETQENRALRASQFQTMAKDARAAGIHPLAAVGGMTGYSAASPTVVAPGVGPGDSAQVAPSASFGERMGTGIADAVQNGLSLYYQIKDQARQDRLAESQILLNQQSGQAMATEAQANTIIARARAAAQNGTRGSVTTDPKKAGDLYGDARRAIENANWKAPDREVEKTPFEDAPAFRNVTAGRYTAGTLNTDVFESEIASMLSDLNTAVQLGGLWLVDQLPEPKKTGRPRGPQRPKGWRSSDAKAETFID